MKFIKGGNEMKKIAQITLIGLLAVMVLLTGCANNAGL